MTQAYTVALAFKTTSRRFTNIGAAVTADDLVGNTPIDAWVAGGFIVANYYTLTTTITSGQSLSAAIGLANKGALSIIMPATWTAADLTFQASNDGVTYNELFNADTPVQLQAAAGRVIRLNPNDWLGIAFLKLRSGTSGAAVTQGGTRVLTILARDP